MAAMGSTMPEPTEAQQAPGTGPSSLLTDLPGLAGDEVPAIDDAMALGGPSIANFACESVKQENAAVQEEEEETNVSDEAAAVPEGVPVVPDQAGASETDINIAMDTGAEATEKSLYPLKSAALANNQEVGVLNNESQVPKDNSSVDDSGTPSRPLPHEIPRGNTIIVNYTPKSFTDESLAEMFSPFGEVESARAIFDRKAAQCLGYGFVKFDSVDSAVSAVKHYETAVPDHRRIKVHFARPKQQCNIYASSLPSHYMGTDMIALFSPYGPVLEVKNLLGKDGENRGCWFVKFGDIDQTHAAVAALNETVPPGGFNRINVSLAAGTKREASTQVLPMHPAMPPTSYFSGTYGRRPPPPPVYPGGGFGDRTAPPPIQPYGYPSAVISPAMPGQYPAATAAPSAGYSAMRHQAIGRPDASPYGVVSREASSYGSAPQDGSSYGAVPQDASSYGAADPGVGSQVRQQRA